MDSEEDSARSAYGDIANWLWIGENFLDGGVAKDGRCCQIGIRVTAAVAQPRGSRQSHQNDQKEQQDMFHFWLLYLQCAGPDRNST